MRTKKQKWIFQTFWTKPMFEKCISTFVKLAYVSCVTAQQQGYKVRMHTDKRGSELLVGVPYDELVVDLDNIPSNVNKRFFAYSKYFAMKSEPIGTIHVDFDIIFNKPCLDAFFNDKNVDVILQMEEHGEQWSYIEAKRLMKKYGLYYSDEVKHVGCSNVGVIGFNNNVLRDKYLEHYFTNVHYYGQFDEIVECHNNIVFDLVFEQTTIDYLRKDYNTHFVYPFKLLHDIQRRGEPYGMVHFQGEEKHKKECMDFINNLYNSFKNQVNLK